MTDRPATPASRPRTPPASSYVARRTMQANRSRDTAPELALRSALHRHGFRFRKHYRVQVRDLAVRVDIAFPARRVAVFVDGCWWHGCPTHMIWPKANAAWWRAKIEANQRRDAMVTSSLSNAGWTVIRVWEHEDIHDAALKVGQAVARQRTSGPT